MHRWRAHLCRCLLPLSPDERARASRSQAAFRPFEAPSSSSESQVFIELSLRRRPSRHADPPRPSLIAFPAPLPAPHACYFHHFYAFVSLLCLYRFPLPPPFSCIYISELNFRSVLPPLPYSCLLLRHHHSGNSFFTLLKFVFTDMSIFFWAVSPGFFFVGDAELLKLLTISESVSARFNRSPDAFLSHR